MGLRYVKVYMLFLGSLLLGGCSLDDDTQPIFIGENTLARIFVRSTRVTLFTRALDRIGYLDSLNGTKKYTVFPPTDDAFRTFLQENEFASITNVPKEVLEEIVLNHMLPGDISIEGLEALDTGYVHTSGTYSMLVTQVDDEVVINGISEFDGANVDIEATNGRIHAVDAVVPLPTINLFLSSDPQLSDFSKALDSAVPIRDLASELDAAPDSDGDAPFTVFVVNNDRMKTFFDANPDWQGTDDIERGILASILEHHIIPNTDIKEEDINDGEQSPDTFEGTPLSFSKSANTIIIEDGSGATTTLLVTDISTMNGTMHQISGLMLPNFNDG